MGLQSFYATYAGFTNRIDGPPGFGSIGEKEGSNKNGINQAPANAPGGLNGWFNSLATALRNNEFRMQAINRLLGYEITPGGALDEMKEYVASVGGVIDGVNANGDIEYHTYQLNPATGNMDKVSGVALGASGSGEGTMLAIAELVFGPNVLSIHNNAAALSARSNGSRDWAGYAGYSWQQIKMNDWTAGYGSLASYRTQGKGAIAAKSAFRVNPSKFDYFFGKVVSGSEHNIARSAQNLKDLTTLGIKSETQLMSTFSQAFEGGTIISTKTSQYGTTIMKNINIGNRGSMNVGFFYQGGNMNTTPYISTIIPKIYK